MPSISIVNCDLSCPYCFSKQVQRHDTDFVGVFLFQRMTCADCNESWMDVYHLIDKVKKDD